MPPGLSAAYTAFVHLCAVDAHVPEIMIVEHDCHEIDGVLVRGWGKRIFELLHDSDHVAGRGILAACGEARGRRRVGALPVDASCRTDRARDELRRVTAARAEIDRDHPGNDADEGQHLGGLAADVVGAIRIAAVGARDDFLDALRCQRCGRGWRLRCELDAEQPANNARITEVTMARREWRDKIESSVMGILSMCA
jgi:hypothetical protein